MHGRVKIQTETQVVAAQDQALAVRAVQNPIYGLSVPVSCRVCGMVPEYVDHLLSSCTPLGATMYKQRHDRIVSIVHWGLLKCFHQSVSRTYWDHIPTAVVENSDVKILWDFNIYTDHFLAARHPDIVVIDKIYVRRWCRLLRLQFLRIAMFLQRKLKRLRNIRTYQLN